MATHEPQTRWLNQASEELIKIAPAGWGFTIYTYRYGKDAEPEQLKPIPGSFLGQEVDQSKSVVAKVAEMVASFHFTVVVDLQVAQLDVGSTAVGSDTKKGAIYAIPVFRPDMYDPSPIMRPLVGVACFASDLLMERVLHNSDLHMFAGRFARIAANEIIDILKSSSVFRQLAWDEIREDILTRLAAQPLIPMKPLNQTRDNSGTTWWEFKPGCFARESDIRKLLWFQERSFVANKIDRWVDPTELSAVRSSELPDIKRYIDTGNFVELHKRINAVTDTRTRAVGYFEIARICMERDDKFNGVIAANKYQEVLGKTPKAYDLLGHVYWWFEDTDTAIDYARQALQLACGLPEEERKKDKDVINRIKNNLAFYFAEKQIEKDRALSYVGEILNEVSQANELYLACLDTAGYVYTKFASKNEDFDKAIKYLQTVLEMEPQSKDAQQHLIEAYEKKKAFRKGESSA